VEELCLRSIKTCGEQQFDGMARSARSLTTPDNKKLKLMNRKTTFYEAAISYMCCPRTVLFLHHLSLLEYFYGDLNNAPTVLLLTMNYCAVTEECCGNCEIIVRRRFTSQLHKYKQ
jgi:hypothetical protein